VKNRNFVAKNMNKFNKPKTEKSKKSYSRKVKFPNRSEV